MIHIGLVTLGCDKNTVDAEYIAGALEREGCRVGVGLVDEDSLDGVVILTCGFIDSATLESRQTIEDWIAAKRARADRPLVVAVAGCLSQDRSDWLAESFPEIDVIAGVGQWDRLARLLIQTAQTAHTTQGDGADRKEGEDLATGVPVGAGLRSVDIEPDMRVDGVLPRRALEHTATAYLKIADGCRYRCSFCVIPRIKGDYRSVPQDVLIAEARGLLDRGAREIILVAQDVSQYGSDLSGGETLAGLLRQLCRLEGDFWVRILYHYPGGLTEDLMDVMATEEKICPYLDIPLQHLDPSIIKSMKRPFYDEDVLVRIDALRQRIPDIALRATFIVGYPGEGKREFMRLLNGLRILRFDHVGFFPFSPQKGTPAAKMGPQVNIPTIRKRCERLARRQFQVAEERAGRFVGRTLAVLVDGRFPDSNLYVGHTRYQTPEVDGMMRFESWRPLEVGQFATVRVTGVDGYDLIGEATSA